MKESSGVMFGYKLMLVKNADLKELKHFKNVVIDLNDTVESFGEFISAGFELDRETATLLTEFNDEIGVYVDMYFNNKFSLPSNSLAMYTNMDKVRSHTLIIIDAINEYNKILSVQSKFQATCEELGEAYSETPDSMMLRSEIQRGFQGVCETIGKASGVILNSLLLLHHAVSGDKLRVDSGYDFIKAYKKRMKRIPKDKNLMSEFTVKFALNTRSDKEYLLKERVKDGKQRSRARAADGGSEKAV